MIQSTSSASLQEELEALRRELRQVPVMEEDGAAPAAGGDMRAAHPYASVAAAFLLGILVANLLSRKG